MAALTALAITSAVATVAGGVASYQQGKAQQDVLKQQAKVAIAKGNIERFQQKQESEKVRKQVTAMAGKGGGSLSGSVLENLNASMTNAALDEAMISYNAKTQANQFIAQGRQARAAGTAALVGSVGQAAMGLGTSGIFSGSATGTKVAGTLGDASVPYPSLQSLVGGN